MKHWSVQDAKARFSELLRASLSEGPQMVTLRGADAAVLVPAEEWRRLQDAKRPNIKELLLADRARTDDLVPLRRHYRMRPPPTFED